MHVLPGELSCRHILIFFGHIGIETHRFGVLFSGKPQRLITTFPRQTSEPRQLPNTIKANPRDFGYEC